MNLVDKEYIEVMKGKKYFITELNKGFYTFIKDTKNGW